MTRALVDLIDLHGRRLHALFAKLTASRDAADELLQDLFVRLLRTSRIADAPNREAYLFRAAINLAFDWRRQNRRAPEFRLLVDEVVTDHIAPLDRLVHHENVERVLEAMEQLSARDRELVSLRFLQGETPEWIAERWRSTPHQIRSRCSKAIARLRKLVEYDGKLQDCRRNCDE
jgi:RNA polymerase sigma-70 factor (ECF subfamily)